MALGSLKIRTQMGWFAALRNEPNLGGTLRPLGFGPVGPTLRIKWVAQNAPTARLEESQYSVFKQPWADPSNTLRRREISTYREKYFRGQRSEPRIWLGAAGRARSAGKTEDAGMTQQP